MEIKFEAANAAEFITAMARISNENPDCVLTGSITFGEGWAKAYQSTCGISHLDLGDTPNVKGCYGYWQKGTLHAWPKSLLTRYANSCITDC